MATAIKKKTADRHKRVKQEFEKWLSENPDADRQRRVRMFDLLADAEYSREKKT